MTTPILLRFSRLYPYLLACLVTVAALGLPLVLSWPRALDVWLVTGWFCCLTLLLTSLGRYAQGNDEPFSLAFLVVLGLLSLTGLVLFLALVTNHTPALVIRTGQLLLKENWKLSFLLVIVLWIVSARASLGCTRVLQVCARYTLDVVPGKQMAIEADLMSGLKDSDQARYERMAIETRLQAAELQSLAAERLRQLSTLIWFLLGLGLLVGATLLLNGTADWSRWLEAIAVLVGAGVLMVGQVSLLSTALGVSVAQGLRGQNVEFLEEALPQRDEVLRTLGAASFELVALAGLGLPPGTSLGLQILFKTNARAQREREAECSQTRLPLPTEPGQTEKTDPMTLELGRALLPLVDPAGETPLLNRIAGIRAEIAADLGFLVPSVQCHDLAQLPPNAYQIWVGNTLVVHSEVRPGRLLALVPEDCSGQVPGYRTAEPVYGMVASWIRSDQEMQAQALGCPVFDCSSLIAAHLGEVMRQNAHLLLTQEELERLLRKSGFSERILWENRSWLRGVAAELLEGGAPLCELETICAVVVEEAWEGWSDTQMADLIRPRLGNSICKSLVNSQGKLYALDLASDIEQALAAGPPGESWTKDFRQAVGRMVDILWEEGVRPVIATVHRRTVRTLVVGIHPDLVVLSPSDIPADIELSRLGTIRLNVF